MLNRQYGLEDWTAATPEEYRELAIRRAADPAGCFRVMMRAYFESAQRP